MRQWSHWCALTRNESHGRIHLRNWMLCWNIYIFVPALSTKSTFYRLAKLPFLCLDAIAHCSDLIMFLPWLYVLDLWNVTCRNVIIRNQPSRSSPSSSDGHTARFVYIRINRIRRSSSVCKWEELALRLRSFRPTLLSRLNFHQEP